MKKKIQPLIILFLSFLLHSCGGVVGNIEKYRFSVTIDSLKAAVKQVYITNPKLRIFDTIKYKQGNALGDGDYYCLIKDDGQEYILGYSYPQYPAPNDTIVEIALTRAAKYGEGLPLAKRISFSEKKKYRKLFENYFISKVKNELKQ